jgi:hypothetical protein
VIRAGTITATTRIRPLAGGVAEAGGGQVDDDDDRDAEAESEPGIRQL